MINSLWDEQGRGWMAEREGAFHTSYRSSADLDDVGAVLTEVNRG